MRDSIGGSVTVVIIVFFIVFALGYLAFNVNYTKAFRMKDKIISLYDDYEGECGPGGSCEDAILAYARKIGYSTDNDIVCPSDDVASYRNVSNLYCVSEVVVVETGEVFGDTRTKTYYRVVTKINLHIPVISNILDFRFFYISGDTKVFEKKGAGN